MTKERNKKLELLVEDLKHEIKNLECEKGQLEGTREYEIKSAKTEAYHDFAFEVGNEIQKALDSNYKTREERIVKHNVDITDSFISHLDGKILALKGIGNFVDDLLTELTERKED